MKIRQKLSIMLSLVLMLSLSIFMPTFADEEQGRTITIIHTNDVHARAEGNDKDIIGYAKLKTFVDKMRKENPATLVVDAGDTLHGTTFANISNGENMIKLMNLIGYSVATPGNHDFNYGYNQLIDLTRKADFPYVCANVVKKDSTQDFLPNTIINVDGIKVGFFGLATPETKYKSSPKNTQGVEFEDYIAVAKRQVEELKQNGAELIVAITHLGLDKSSEQRSDILAEKVQGIDLIIDGHSHTKLENGKTIGKTTIAQTGEYLKNIGIVKIQFTPTSKIEDIKCSLLTFDQAKEIKPDKQMLNAIESANLQNKPILQKKIGTTNTELIGVREKVRTSQTNLGDLITDAMKNAVNADVAITNGGGIRASIPQGQITMGDVLTTFPFTNFVIGIEVTGQDIKQALEHGVDKAPQAAGKFPQVSGLTYDLDLSKPAGQRVSNIMVDKKPLELKKVYKLATNDFMAIGGDGYVMLKGHKKFAENALLSDVLIDFIKSKGSVIDYKASTRVHLVKAGEIRKPQVQEDKKQIIENKSKPQPKPEIKKEEKPQSTKAIKKDDEKINKLIERLEGKPRPAQVSSHKMILNGKSITVPCYIIEGQKYFKIRDLAQAFKGTDSEFAVGYRPTNNTLILQSNKKYQSNNTKFEKLKSGVRPQEFTPNIEIDGVKQTGKLKVYLLDGNNYFNLNALKPMLKLNI